MDTLTIKLTTREADLIFPTDTNGDALKIHREDAMRRILEEVNKNAGPFDMTQQCTNWVYYGSEEMIHKDQHGDEIMNVAECMFGSQKVLWVCLM